MYGDLIAFIQERHAIYVRRAAGLPKPWTTDPILQEYRFCNVYRELDTVTVWLREKWREPYADHPNLWFAMALARSINWPDTLEDIGFPENWNPARARDIMVSRAAHKLKVYTGAYMLRGDIQLGEELNDKPTYTCFKVLTPLYRSRDAVPVPGEYLGQYHNRLKSYGGWGSFLAAQVVCDLKYTRWLKDAPDWWGWSAPGPGSTRGLNRVLKRELGRSFTFGEWCAEMRKLYRAVNSALGGSMPLIHAQDLQNCLCEYDKWLRVKLGEGRSRSRYPGKA